MKIVAIDVEALVKFDVSKKSLQEYKSVFASLLKKPALKKAQDEELLSELAEYTGLNASDEHEKIILKRFIKETQQLVFLGVSNKQKEKLFYDDVIEYLGELKREYKLVLLSTLPEDVVLPFLHVHKLPLFDLVISAPASALLESCRRKTGKPACVICFNEELLQSCRSSDVKSILSAWVEEPSPDKRALADEVASTVQELSQSLSSILK